MHVIQAEHGRTLGIQSDHASRVVPYALTPSHLIKHYRLFNSFLWIFFEFFGEENEPSFANMVGANSSVDLVVWESCAGLVGLVLSLGSVAELAVQLHHSLHTLEGSRVGC